MAITIHVTNAKIDIFSYDKILQSKILLKNSIKKYDIKP